MRLNEHRIMFLPEYYAAGKGNSPFPALSFIPSPWTCQPFLRQDSSGTAYRISDFPCFACMPPGLFPGYKIMLSATEAYCPEIQPTISRYLSAMKGKSAPYFPPTHTVQSSWKDIAFEHFLQNPLKTHWFFTDWQNPLCNALHLIPSSWTCQLFSRQSSADAAQKIHPAFNYYYFIRLS